MEMLNQIENYDNQEIISQQYISPTFLYGMLNQALRHIDLKILFLMGFFVHDLYWDIKQRYFNSLVNQNKIIVYRGQM